MRLQQSILPIVLLVGLVLFAIENWSPMVSLTLLGMTTMKLPLVVWVLAAGLTGSLTTLAIALCLRIVLADPTHTTNTSPSPTSSNVRPPSHQNPTYDQPHTAFRAHTTPIPNSSAPSNKDHPKNVTSSSPFAYPPNKPNTFKRNSQHNEIDNWEEFSRPKTEWEDWQRPTSLSQSPQATHKTTKRPSNDVTEVPFETQQSQSSRFYPSETNHFQQQQPQSSRNRPFSDPAPFIDSTHPPLTTSGEPRDYYSHPINDENTDDNRVRDKDKERSPDSTQPHHPPNHHLRDHDVPNHRYADHHAPPKNRYQQYSDRSSKDNSSTNRQSYQNRDQHNQYAPHYSANSYNASAPDSNSTTSYNSPNNTRFETEAFEANAINPPEQFIMDYGDETALDAFENDFKSPSSQYRWAKKQQKNKTTDNSDIDLTDLEEGWD